MYYTYIIRCVDNSLYTGITNNLERRMNEHFGRLEKCAKYTYTHPAKKVECVFSTTSRSLAAKLEYHLKHLTKQEKEDLIKDKISLEILNSKINPEDYQKMKYSCQL